MVVKKKGGRPTNAEMAQKRLDAEVSRRYEEQEAKRAKPIQIDQIVVLVGWLIGVAIAFTTSAVVSFNGITSVAPFVGLSFAWMAWLFFFFIEVMYLIFLVAYLVLASRVNESTWGALAGMWFFAGVAILGNAYHTLRYHDWDIGIPDTWAGVVLSIAAPIAILSVSKLASRVVFARSVVR